jgi:hypothetical protein
MYEILAISRSYDEFSIFGFMRESDGAIIEKTNPLFHHYDNA